MSDVFVSYARSTEAQARQIAEALSALGYAVWRDDALPAHRAYAQVIEERLKAAKAVVVVWSAEAVASQWVRAEADMAREAGKLIQLSLDGVTPPLPFNQIQCADMNGWSGEADAPGWRKVVSGVGELIAGSVGDGAHPSAESGARAKPDGPFICVLPFINMSGDPEQEYFSDGITEDVITDLSKISALQVTARNTAFTFKGKSVDVTQIARQLNVSHVLEGSVRKASGRVRITAQLVDGASGGHVWAERYDRDLNDIFALQDEISQAIVTALKLKLLPAERKAIEHRGTTDSEAYKLYLMARQYEAMGNERHMELIVRLCRNAVEIDPGYARAWALMGYCQARMALRRGVIDDGRATALRALELDPQLAEAHVAHAYTLSNQGRWQESLDASERALRLDPECVGGQRQAGLARLALHQYRAAIEFFDRAVAQDPTDYAASGQRSTCYEALGDMEAAREVERQTLAIVEKIITTQPDHGSALSFGVGALAGLNQVDRAKEWAQRAVLVDPENINLHYNLACAMARLRETDAALDLLNRNIATVPLAYVKWMEIDGDLNSIRDDPRFKALVASVYARAGAESESDTAA
jgi:adenylate cyclase